MRSNHTWRSNQYLSEWKLWLGIGVIAFAGLLLFTVNSNLITGGKGAFGLEDILPYWMFPPERFIMFQIGNTI